MWKIEYTTIDTIQHGDTKYRLVESERGKRHIELWSSLSNCWRAIYKYKVDVQWASLKRYEAQRKNR